MIGYILLGISVAFMIGITCFLAGFKVGVEKTIPIVTNKAINFAVESLGLMFIKLGYTEQFSEVMKAIEKEKEELYETGNKSK